MITKRSLLLVVLILYSKITFAQQRSFDVCVYGSTPSGIAASIQAARMGKRVVLLSTSSHVGGMMTAGLTATDINNYQYVGGIAKEIFERLYIYYLNPKVWKYQTRSSFFTLNGNHSFGGKNDQSKMQWVYEPNVLENILKKMLKEANVKVAFNQIIKLKNGVSKNNNHINFVLTNNDHVYSAKVYIDASYEGDLMARTGVSYNLGRESNKQFNETLNGRRPNEGTDNELKFVSPYILTNGHLSLLPYIEAYSSAPFGSADKKVQAYGFRLTLTDVVANSRPIAKPTNYNSLWFEFLGRMFNVHPNLKLGKILSITPMPNRKVDVNGLDFVGANYNYVEDSEQARLQLNILHKDYALGMLWFLQNDIRVPQSIRKEIKKWRLTRDEYQDSENFPQQLYIREGRRMQGEFIMREQNCDGSIPLKESIGVGTYKFDCHTVSRELSKNGDLISEGRFYEPDKPYTISYKVLLPRIQQCDNLLVSSCISATHVAYSTIRMEPVYLLLGQAAGTLAVIAINQKTAIQYVSYSSIKQQLIKDKQILEPSQTILEKFVNFIKQIR